MPRVKDILAALLEWAPASLAWEKDNIGLLLGSADAPVERVLVCLDVTPAVVEEAVARDASCIVAHHTVIFHPLRNIRTDRYPGNMIARLLAENISVIAMHTNADAASGGLNTALAQRFGLQDCSRLDPARGQRRLLGFLIPGDIATLGGLPGQLAAIDGVDVVSVREEQGSVAMDVAAPDWKLAEVRALAAASDAAQTYLSVLEDAAEGYGIGVVGMLEQEMTAGAFLGLVKHTLACDNLRCTPHDEARAVRRVAVSSGAGSSFVRAAVAAGADALVTGDLTHHVFLDHQHDLLLVDAGHYETEHIFIDICAEELSRRSFQDKQKIDILRVQTDSNPIRFV